MRKRAQRYIVVGFLVVLVILVLIPVVYMILHSFADPEDVIRMYQGNPRFLPDQISLMAYYRILFSEPGYLLKFWRSLGMCLLIAGGQTLVSCMAGMGFAKYKFTGQKYWLALMLFFMLLPIQVTLLPNYIVLEKLHFINTYKALIIPGIFAPFGVVFMTLIFRGMPSEWIEAACMDGAGKLKILSSILIPAGKTGVITLFVLSFVDSWNMVEQPMVFLGDETKYPLSVFLAGMNADVSLQFVCGVLSLIPVTLLFLYFHKELLEGIKEYVWR